MFVRSRILNAILFVLITGGCALLGYHGYDWWKTAQKRRQLFLYFQKESPVTQRIPEDATVYLNLFDFKRVHSGLYGTKLNETLAHWIDTELSGNHDPNPMMGGMLEKTILNVIGEEFGIALLPSIDKKLDLFAIARLAPGSDFILGIALASNRKLKKMQVQNDTVYVLPSGDLKLGDLYVLVKSSYAYAATDLQRIRSALKGASGGPSFLRSLSVHQIPEDTFLFIQAKEPALSAIAYGKNNRYTLEASSESLMHSSIPAVPASSAVFQFQTNATEIFGQPSASFALQSIDGVPAARFAFGFASSEAAQRFESSFLNGVNYEKKLQDNFANAEVRCFPFQIEDDYWTLCSKGRTYLLAEELIDLKTAASGMQEAKTEKLPITLRVQARSAAIANYQEKIESGDRSEFSRARAFYFLSCLKRIQGSINGYNHEIVAEIQ
ncbi:hypothetical protein L0222_32445 [bacterium]|nr:hypothetical protein [bacterium]